MEGQKLPVIRDDRIYMSAKKGQGITELTEMIQSRFGGKETYDKRSYF
jgi:hypothetical protein